MTIHNKLTTITGHHHHHQHDENQGNDDGDEMDDDQSSLIIFDSFYCGELVPEGFNAVRISIDGGMTADLSWKKEREAALTYISQGLRIFWEIDLGFADGLHHPLENRTQFLALSLSLEHFCQILWNEFRKETVGLCVYRGDLDFNKIYPWKGEAVDNLHSWIKGQFGSLEVFFTQTSLSLANFEDLTVAFLKQSHVGNRLLLYYCRDMIAEYLNLLVSGITSRLPFFMLLDASAEDDSFTVAHLLAKDRFKRFHLGIKKCLDKQVLGGELGWEAPFLEKGMLGRSVANVVKSERAPLGFCLPKELSCIESVAASLSNVLQELKKNQIPLRVISEVELSTEWDGLDYLIVDVEKVDMQFKRKLQGFCAAGGTVVSVGEGLLGLSNEISFADFMTLQFPKFKV